MSENVLKFDALVIGSGCAGLNAACRLAQAGCESFALITEDLTAGTSLNAGSDKQTYYRLSLAGDEPDSVGEVMRLLAREDVHQDTALCEAAGSAAGFLRLAELGVPFPMNEYGEYVGYRTDHDARLRASSAGPLTSRYMAQALLKEAKRLGVKIYDHALLTRIYADGAGVQGALCLDLESRQWLRFQAPAIILCTGGPAHLYADRVFPDSQHGMSGAAFEAGARGANLHCWQYGIASVGFKWNLSGSYQQAIPRYVSVDETGCQREFLRESLSDREILNLTFLKGYEWPYDPRKAEGSSKIDLMVLGERQKGRRVFLDYRQNPTGYDVSLFDKETQSYLANCGALKETPIERLRSINPPAIELFASHGIDLFGEALEISVCAQHHNGGIAVDAWWQSDVSGLYACGEAAGTFGAYRPGGSALNSTQVGSTRAARHIMRQERACAAPDFALPLLPRGDASDLTAYFQTQMSRFGGIQRDAGALKRLRGEALSTLENAEEARLDDPKLLERILLKDILLTLVYVTDAMLYALSHADAGVLETDKTGSCRVPPRPAAKRDLWFERVWKAASQSENNKLDG
ncbi:MAG: FAD-binding protein [Clostridia bacterium]|nr:FAD-binding protein [Clostridia bacterium]